MSALAALKAYQAAQTLSEAGGKTPSVAPASVGQEPFSSMLGGAVGQVQELAQRSDGQMGALAIGSSDLVDVVTAVTEAETALQTLTAVRDRMIQAYEEIMRMPV